MILAKARLIGEEKSRVAVGLTFPTGFDPEEVAGESVRASGGLVPERVCFDPRCGGASDIFREFEAVFPAEALEAACQEGRVEITGRFRRGVHFTAVVQLQPAAAGDH